MLRETSRLKNYNIKSKYLNPEQNKNMMTKIVVLVTGFDSGIPAPKFVAPKIL